MAVEKYEITTYPERRYIIFKDIRGSYLLSFSKSQIIHLTSDENSRKEYDFLAVKVMDVEIEDDSRSQRKIKLSDSKNGYEYVNCAAAGRKCAFSFKKSSFERIVMDDFAGAKLMYELIE